MVTTEVLLLVAVHGEWINVTRKKKKVPQSAPRVKGISNTARGINFAPASAPTSKDILPTSGPIVSESLSPSIPSQRKRARKGSPILPKSGITIKSIKEPTRAPLKRDVGKRPVKISNPFTSWTGKEVGPSKKSNVIKNYDLGGGTFSAMGLEKISESMFRFVDKKDEQEGDNNPKFNGVFKGGPKASEPPDPEFKDLRILVWNIRGAIGARGRRRTKDLVTNLKPELFIILETYCQFVKASSFWQDIKPGVALQSMLTLCPSFGRAYGIIFVILEIDRIPSLDNASVISLEAPVTLDEVRRVVMSMEKSMRRFLWAGQDKDCFHALVGWDWVTTDKNSGGLGLRDLRLMNTALLGKLIWSLLYDKDKQ
ncbi:ribonuclease H [Sesbania bispinosa]|nr:ribonuclease H [Sesbania bispinosa]